MNAIVGCPRSSPGVPARLSRPMKRRPRDFSRRMGPRHTPRNYHSRRDTQKPHILQEVRSSALARHLDAFVSAAARSTGPKTQADACISRLTHASVFTTRLTTAAHSPKGKADKPLLHVYTVTTLSHPDFFRWMRVSGAQAMCYERGPAYFGILVPLGVSALATGSTFFPIPGCAPHPAMARSFRSMTGLNHFNRASSSLKSTKPEENRRAIVKFLRQRPSSGPKPRANHWVDSVSSWATTSHSARTNVFRPSTARQRRYLPSLASIVDEEFQRAGRDEWVLGVCVAWRPDPGEQGERRWFTSSGEQGGAH
ncbi:hypothetical protein FA13DRAFT_162754 [Coprinellus micaceus]|uniref:Uncharacterized protein n=1 Tax=Coprinellus micaceus TaxID=71717 RepID=A0A4Y7TJ83_COPMI|nr:hypothetical protein FA13DRAFT_162754 [Coprinellus micaceus]